MLRGLALTPVKFGICFTKRTLNQANALVNIYTDGTVQVSTGGTEMGQGLNTRVRQLVADEFGIDYDARARRRRPPPRRTTTPRRPPLSSGTDLNGAAAVDACEQLSARLAEFAARLLADAAAGLHAVAERRASSPTATSSIAATRSAASPSAS